MKRTLISPKFLDLAPKELDEGVLYISQKHRTAIHKCCCGCGEKVVTPLSPAHWQIRVTGDSISLHPSIGNWGMACQSHYWIQGNKVVWAGAMSPKQIAAVRKRDRIDQTQQIARVNREKVKRTDNGSWLSRLWRYLVGP